MAATIHQLRGCLGGLSETDRRLLILRFGVGGRPMLTDAQVAARLGLTPAQVTNRDIVAVRRLTVVRRFGGCRSTTRVATAASSSLATPPALSLARPHHSGGGISVEEAIAIALIAVCLIVIAREFRNLMFPPIPR